MATMKTKCLMLSCEIIGTWYEHHTKQPKWILWTKWGPLKTTWFVC